MQGLQVIETDILQAQQRLFDWNIYPTDIEETQNIEEWVDDKL